MLPNPLANHGDSGNVLYMHLVYVTGCYKVGEQYTHHTAQVISVCICSGTPI
jgi:hypothetical protein